MSKRSNELKSRDFAVNGKTHYAQWTGPLIVSRTVFSRNGELIRVQERVTTGSAAWNATYVEGVNRRVTGVVFCLPGGIPVFIQNETGPEIERFKRKRKPSQFNWPHPKASQKEKSNARHR